jgi:hypothetical protein
MEYQEQTSLRLALMTKQSAFLPLVVWTPSIIVLFTLLRIIFGTCSVESEGNTASVMSESNTINSIAYKAKCNLTDFLIDSLAAYFQFPRSEHSLDIVERITSAPILGTAFIAVRRKFERIK